MERESRNDQRCKDYRFRYINPSDEEFNFNVNQGAPSKNLSTNFDIFVVNIKFHLVSLSSQTYCLQQCR